MGQACWMTCHVKIMTRKPKIGNLTNIFCGHVTISYRRARCVPIRCQRFPKSKMAAMQQRKLQEGLELMKEAEKW